MDDEQRGVQQAGASDEEVMAYLRHIEEDRTQLLDDSRRRQRDTEAEIVQRWGQALDQYDLLVYLSIRAIRLSEKVVYAHAVAHQDVVYEALHALVARSCQTAKEIRALLAAGYASAAATRWRSLHELHVVAALIGSHPSGLAEHYLLHDIVQRHKLACSVEEVYRGIQADIPDNIRVAIADVRREYDRLRVKYKQEPDFFKGDYGWAKRFVPNATIDGLEKAAGLGDRRFAYRLASASVHPNIAGAFAGSQHTPAGDLMVIGPSSVGLMEPGVSASFALSETTRILLKHSLKESNGSEPERRELTLIGLALPRLFEDVVRAFQAANGA